MGPASAGAGKNYGRNFLSITPPPALPHHFTITSSTGGCLWAVKRYKRVLAVGAEWRVEARAAGEASSVPLGKRERRARRRVFHRIE